MTYGHLFTTMRWIYRRFAPRYRVTGAPPEGVGIWVCRHGGDITPVRLMAWAERPVRIWALRQFCDRKMCYRQYVDYTFTVRYGMPRAVACVLAWCVSGPVSALLKSIRAIPVSRGTWAMRDTLNDTVDALCAGDSICLFPDVNYTQTDGEVGKLYTGFLNIARMVYDRTGEVIPFVPLQVDHERREIRFGKPVYFDTNRHFAHQKGELSEKIAAAL